MTNILSTGDTNTKLVKKINEEKKRIKKEQRKVNATEGIRLDGRRAGMDWVVEQLDIIEQEEARIIQEILDDIEAEGDQGAEEVTGITVVLEDGKYAPVIKCAVCAEPIIHGHCAKVKINDDGTVEFIHVFMDHPDCDDGKMGDSCSLDIFMYKLLNNTGINIDLAEEASNMLDEVSE